MHFGRILETSMKVQTLYPALIGRPLWSAPSGSKCSRRFRRNNGIRSHQTPILSRDPACLWLHNLCNFAKLPDKKIGIVISHKQHLHLSAVSTLYLKRSMKLSTLEPLIDNGTASRLIYTNRSTTLGRQLWPEVPSNAKDPVVYNTSESANMSPIVNTRLYGPIYIHHDYVCSNP